jgi:phosphohistidine phosphatase
VTTRQIWLLRHAKSDWADATIQDHDRPLNNRGRRSAAKVAATLQREKIRPEVVLVSTARRAMETVSLLDVDVIAEPRLYNATADELMQRLQEFPAGVSSVMLVGHNPGMEDLASRLGDMDGMSTATLLQFEVDAETWDNLRVEDARRRGRWEHPGKK